MLSEKSPHNYISYLSSQLPVGGGVSWTHTCIPCTLPPLPLALFQCRQPSHNASATCYLTTDTRSKGRREETQMETSSKQDQNGTMPDFPRIRESQNLSSPNSYHLLSLLLVAHCHFST